MEKLPGLILLGFVYILPWLVARLRNHPSATAILALNLLLGWTFLFWVVSLVWALTGRPDSGALRGRSDFSRAIAREKRHSRE